MAEISVEKKFAVLVEISRAQHFAWREAVAKLCPEIDTAKVVNAMWGVTGAQTAKAYAKRLDKSRPLAPQVAACIAWSSRCMGEDASVEATGDGEAHLKHSDCPWFHWHKRLDLLTEDRPGCDAWFDSTINHLNEILSTKIRFETLSTLPDGDSACVRRFWEA